MLVSVALNGTYGRTKKQQMKILYVGSAEALPFASTGGLGDVLGALPAAVKRALGEGGDVRVVIPMYRCIKEQYLSRCTFVCQTEVWGCLLAAIYGYFFL